MFIKLYNNKDFYRLFDPKIYYTEIIKKFISTYNCIYEVNEDKFCPIIKKDLIELYDNSNKKHLNHPVIKGIVDFFISGFFNNLLMINFINDNKITLKDLETDKIIYSDSVYNINISDYIETLFIFNTESKIFVNFKLSTSIFFSSDYLGLIFDKNKNCISLIPKCPEDNIFNLKNTENINKQHLNILISKLENFSFNQIFLAPKLYIKNTVKMLNGNLDHYNLDIQSKFNIYFLLNLENKITRIYGNPISMINNDLCKWFSYFEKINLPYNNKKINVDEVCVNLHSEWVRTPKHYKIEEKIFRSINNISIKDYSNSSDDFEIFIYVKKNRNFKLEINLVPRDIQNIDNVLVNIIDHLNSYVPKLKVYLLGVHTYSDNNLDVTYKKMPNSGLQTEYDNYNKMFNFITKNSQCKNIELLNGLSFNTFIKKCYNTKLFIGQFGGNIGNFLSVILNKQSVFLDKLAYFGNSIHFLTENLWNLKNKYPIMTNYDKEVNKILSNEYNNDDVKYRCLSEKDINDVKQCIDKIVKPMII